MEWQTIIKTIAPLIGTSLGGPLGGIAVEAIGQALNMPKATTESINSLFEKGITPEHLAAVKNAEQDYAFKMKQLGFEHAEAIANLNAEVAKTEMQDRGSARQLQAQTKSLVPTVLTYANMTAFFLFSLLAFLGYAKVDSALAGAILMHIFNAYNQSNNFQFGSSASSQNKDNLLSRIRGSMQNGSQK